MAAYQESCAGKHKPARHLHKYVRLNPYVICQLLQRNSAKLGHQIADQNSIPTGMHFDSIKQKKVIFDVHDGKVLHGIGCALSCRAMLRASQQECFATASKLQLRA